MRDIVILGGPNGAGKTTAAPFVVPRELGIREFVNADEIARGLSPFNAEGVAVAAGRLMIDRMRMLVREGQSFAFETTCSGRAHAGWLRACKADDWRITLVYLWLRSPQMGGTARPPRRSPYSGRCGGSPLPLGSRQHASPVFSPGRRCHHL
jgi:predicted ABC-type ATPase